MSPSLRICVVCLHLLLAAHVAARPSPPEVWLEGEHVKTSRRVMFKTGLVQFTDDSAVVVNAVAAFALQQGAVVIVIEGHTDAGGDERENIRLSQGRADELRRALIRRGLAADQVQAIGRGSAAPLVAASHREQYRNRRVEFFVRPQQTSASNVVPTSADLVVEAAPAARVVIAPRITLLDDDEPLLPLPRVTLLDDVDDDELLFPRFGGPAILLLDEIGYPDR